MIRIPEKCPPRDVEAAAVSTKALILSTPIDLRLTPLSHEVLSISCDTTEQTRIQTQKLDTRLRAQSWQPRRLARLKDKSE
jgi:hypothetical protein